MSRYFAPAKINFGLKITGRLSNGYHEIASLFYPLPELFDVLEIETGAENGLEIDLSGAAIDGENILRKTYRIFTGEYHFFPPLHISLRKRIPIGAGLGGGSSDAACLLRVLASMTPQPVPERDLLELGARIGADVPFFLIGKPAFVTGIGEKIQPLPRWLPESTLVLVWPGISISTAWAFQAYDATRDGLAKNGQKANHSENILTKVDVEATHFFPEGACALTDMASLLQNDLEDPVFESYPLLAELGKNLRALGACVSGMSGSGSSMYGIFNDQKAASEAEHIFKKKYNNVYRFSI